MNLIGNHETLKLWKAAIEDLLRLRQINSKLNNILKYAIKNFRFENHKSNFS